MINKHTIWTALLAASFLGTVACTDDEGNSETMDDETTTGGSASGGKNGATGGAAASGGDRPGGTGGGSGGTDGGSGGTDGGSGGTNGGAGGDTSACSTLGIAESAGLTSLVAAVEAAGLAATIEDGDDLTIFAPTNDAFADLLDAVGVTGLSDLTAEQLVPILTYHVAGSVIASDDAVAAAAGAGRFETLGGTVAIVGETSDGLFLDPDEANAQIDLSAVDVEACNGTIVHVIDAVILPSIADIVTTQPGFSGLLSLVAAADAGTGVPKVGAALDGSADAEDGDPVEAFTLFAPSNAAVDAVVEALGDSVPENQTLTDLLLYHVYAGGPAVDAGAAIAGGSDQELPTLAGSNLTVDGEAGPPPVVSIQEGSAGAAAVVVANIYASNGIIHVVDDVLLP